MVKPRIGDTFDGFNREELLVQLGYYNAQLVAVDDEKNKIERRIGEIQARIDGLPRKRRR